MYKSKSEGLGDRILLTQAENRIKKQEDRIIEMWRILFIPALHNTGNPLAVSAEAAALLPNSFIKADSKGSKLFFILI